eukprot:4748054-Amphidinium_carterae.1
MSLPASKLCTGMPPTGFISLTFELKAKAALQEEYGATRLMSLTWKPSVVFCTTANDRHTLSKHITALCRSYD